MSTCRLLDIDAPPRVAEAEACQAFGGVFGGALADPGHDLDGR